MPLPRLIPILLLDQDYQLVKTRKFKNQSYIGDPLMAMRLFNDLGADEILILSIGDKSYMDRSIPLKILEDLAGEALMPLSFGGNIKSREEALKIISLGYEKVIYSASRLFDGTDIRSVIDTLGKQSVGLCINYAESNLFGRTVRCHKSNKKLGDLNMVTKIASEIGFGELILQNMTREGQMSGLDVNVIDEISEKYLGPVLITGGLGRIDELKSEKISCISGIAGGSFFVYSGSRRGVLISYPDDSERGI
jgi:cyclase